MPQESDTSSSAMEFEPVFCSKKTACRNPQTGAEESTAEQSSTPDPPVRILMPQPSSSEPATFPDAVAPASSWHCRPEPGEGSLFDSARNKTARPNCDRAAREERPLLA